MSFGEGNKRVRIDELTAEVAQLKRSLGGSQAANSRLKGENRTLTEALDKVKDVNGALCAEVNEKDRRIRNLESLVRDLWRGYACDTCTMIAECPAEVRWNGGECKMEKRMTDALGKVLRKE